MPRSGSGFKTVVFAGLAALAAAGTAQAAVPAPENRIAAVVVRVEGEETRPDLRALVPLVDGEPCPPGRIDAAVKQIYETGLFADVEVRTEGEGDVRLTFILKRKLFTRSIKFTGGAPVSRRTLLAGIYALRPDTEYSEPRLRRAEDELREILRNEGFLDAAIQAAAQPDPSGRFVDIAFEIETGRRFTVRSVEIQGGLEGVQVKAFRSLASRAGSPYRPASLEADLEAIKAAYIGLGYPRAEVAVQNRFFRSSDSTVGLVLRIDPGERVRITFTGADVPESLVRPLWEERIFENWGLDQADAAILNYLRKKGHVFASVRSSVERNPGELHIIHQIEPGAKIRISSVAFEGAAVFPDAELRRVIGLTPQLPIIGGVPGDRMFSIPTDLEDFYRSEGFPEARVSLQFKSRAGGYQAVFVIEEGPRKLIRDVTILNAAVIAAADLAADLQCRAGGPYDAGRVRRDAERIETIYANRGFRGTTVEARAEELEDGRFDVIFILREGRPIRVVQIVVSGNAVTRRDVIDRALLLKVGDPSRADLILESKRRLERLGVFVEVKIEEIVSGDGETLVVSLREGERNYAAAGIGLETKNELSTSAIWDNVLRPRFTAEFIRMNMLGRAAQLSLVGQFSLMEKRAVASWESPTLFGLPYQAAFNAYLEREERVSYGFDRRGAGISAVRSIGTSWTSLTTLSYARTTLYFLETSETEVDRQHYPYSATALSESVIWDARDDTFNPSRGHFFSAMVAWAYPLFNAESDYLKSFFKFQYYRPVGQRVLLLGTFRGGLAMGRMPIHERFFAGGSGSFRGQPFDGLGPTDAGSGKPVGGKAIVLFNFDAQVQPFPSWPALSLAVFYDMGNVFSHRNDISLAALEDALGFGFRYKTPLGPLRIDLGWNLNPKEGNRGPRLYVTIGNVF